MTAQIPFPTPLSVLEAIQQRRSVRGFKADPVAPEILQRIFQLAQQAPSNCNIQPWHVYVASGSVRTQLRDRLVKAALSGNPLQPDFDYPDKFEGDYRRRQVECAQALYGHMGIERQDKIGRARAMLRNFEFFDAPHVAFIAMDKCFGATVALDIGGYLQNLMLAMTDQGVACCPQGALRSYPHITRELLGIPDNLGILVGLSFGYEDESIAANRTRMGRDAVSANVHFC